MLRFRHIILLVLVILLCLGSAFACGDKLLVMGHGFTFASINRSTHPASILLYINPRSQLPVVDKDVQLQTVLRSAGHKPKSIESRTEFLSELTSGEYDVVISDFSDAGALKSAIAAAAGKPMLLPILYKPSKDQMAAAQKQFSCALKAEKNNRILTVVDDAMKSKQKGTTPRCETP